MVARAVVLLAVVCAVGCSGSANTRPSTAQTAGPGLVLSLAVVKDTVVDVVFTNSGTAPVWFRPSFVIDNIGVDRVGVGAVKRTCVTDDGIYDVPDDQAAPFRTPASDYRLLRHGDSERWPMDLRECFDLERPGDYILTASWQDWDYTPPDTPPGATLVKGPLEAAPVELHLK